MRKAFGFVLFFLILTITLTGQTLLDKDYKLLNSAGFVENWEIRAKLKDLILAPAGKAMRSPAAIYTIPSHPEDQVEVEVRKTEQHFYIVFKNSEKKDFPLVGRGNYIVKKEIETGKFVQLKIFLQSEHDFFIRLYPYKSKTKLDFFFYGERIYHDIILPVEFEYLLTAPFSKIMTITSNTIDWSCFFIDSGYQEWNIIKNMITYAQSNHYKMGNVYDGAQNAMGEYVYIESGEPLVNEEGFNCSGYAKWIADGIYAGIVYGSDAVNRTDKRYLSIASLKKKHTKLRSAGNSWVTSGDTLDAWFGLDWCRNIAVSLYEARAGVKVDDPTSMDVTYLPYFYYTPDVGFSVDKIKPVLYLLATKNPGSIYFGTVSLLRRGSSNVRLYSHVAVFVPYFDKDGDFKVVVLETGEANSLDSLESRYPSSFIHFSQAKTTKIFAPPEVSTP